jgi:hypothetical protein
VFSKDWSCLQNVPFPADVSNGNLFVITVAVTAGNIESGFRISSFGKNARNIVDNFGIKLVSYTKLEKRVKHSALWMVVLSC